MEAIVLTFPPKILTQNAFYFYLMILGLLLLYPGPSFSETFKTDVQFLNKYTPPLSKTGCELLNQDNDLFL